MVASPYVNNIAAWLPPLVAAGLPTPDTWIVREAPGELAELLDGRTPEGFWEFIDQLAGAVERVGGAPCFLRTGHGSGKHQWKDTCFLADADRDVLAEHVSELVEWSLLSDVMGLPFDTWAVRELIDTEPLFRCSAYGDFPVTREFRFFVRDGRVVHAQPYWPVGACEAGRPDRRDWQLVLQEASKMTRAEYRQTRRLAERAGRALTDAEFHPYWSVDLLQDRHGDWFVIDCADGDRSYRSPA